MSTTNEGHRSGSSFGAGFGLALGGIFGLVFFFVIIPTIWNWATNGRPIQDFVGTSQYQGTSNPNADNVPPGFRVIRR